MIIFGLLKLVVFFLHIKVFDIFVSHTYRGWKITLLEKGNIILKILLILFNRLTTSDFLCGFYTIYREIKKILRV